MRVLVAGATGAIGTPLIRSLRANGHAVFGMTHSTDAFAALASLGAEPIAADALDSASVLNAIKRVRPDAIINELTSLPKHYTPDEMKAAAERDRQVRVEGNANLLAGARATGVRRYLLQSSGFWYAPGPGLADENAPFAFDATPAIAAGTRTYSNLEASTLGQPGLEAVALRYGFFYGPGTWFTSEGDVGEQVRKQQLPVIGEGRGVWSWVHIEDAAAATVSALGAPPGVYNVVDNDPSEHRVWLPAFAEYVGAPEPPHVSEEQANETAGPDAVYYATRLRGASNEKAKRELKFHPRHIEWFQNRVVTTGAV
jgi:nucleoside-diphosphate-sugar epimerase